MQEQTNLGATGSSQPGPASPRRRRGENRINWVRQLHTWHFMSSAICLVGLLLFAITGITLNNAHVFERKEPTIERATAKLPPAVLADIARVARDSPAKLPEEAATWLQRQHGLKAASQRLDWSETELGISAPRPGGLITYRIDLKSGELEFERTDRGVIAFLNDLHKGRHAGPVWGWFLDVFAAAALLSAITGLLIVARLSGMRRSAWPLVALGVILPAILAIMFVH